MDSKSTEEVKQLDAEQGTDSRVEEKIDAEQAWAGGLSLGLSLATGPAVVAACRRKSPRVTAAGGGLLSALGCLFLSFAARPHQALLSYGVFLAVGLGTAREAAGLVVSQYFRRRRPAVEAWLCAAQGLGLAACGPLMARLLRGIRGIRERERRDPVAAGGPSTNDLPAAAVRYLASAELTALAAGQALFICSSVTSPDVWRRIVETVDLMAAGSMGWRLGLHALAGLLFGLFLLAALYRPASIYHPQRRAILHLKHQRRRNKRDKPPYCDFSGLRSRSVQVVALSASLASFGIYSPFFFFVSTSLGIYSPFFFFVSTSFGIYSPFFFLVSTYLGIYSPFFFVSTSLGIYSPFFFVSTSLGIYSPFFFLVSTSLGIYSPFFFLVSTSLGIYSPFFFVSTFLGIYSPFFLFVSTSFDIYSPFFFFVSTSFGIYSPFFFLVSTSLGIYSPFFFFVSTFHGIYSPFFFFVCTSLGIYSPLFFFVSTFLGIYSPYFFFFVSTSLGIYSPFFFFVSTFLGIYSPYFFLAYMARKEGLELGAVVTLHVYLGLAMSAGSLAFAAMVVHAGPQCSVSRQYLAQSALAGAGLSLLALHAVRGFHGYVLFVCLFGACCGGFQYSLKVLLLQRVRPRHFERAWGFVQGSQFVPVLLGSPLTEYINANKSPKDGFYFSAGCAFAGFVALFWMTRGPPPRPVATPPVAECTCPHKPPAPQLSFAPSLDVEEEEWGEQGRTMAVIEEVTSSV
ncbi:hypothetical protein LAZ67_1003610 [Cordylochernes scorpioides]|uniref:Uncharacterized protein n=1 Tax=Cordylochernes scorpioides TaxID=51811 RepID=A0ABY6K1S9_9ARAC|nr:hypothetical protein LAZ67_1003610 [Cordylochernes scorpioides]